MPRARPRAEQPRREDGYLPDVGMCAGRAVEPTLSAAMLVLGLERLRNCGGLAQTSDPARAEWWRREAPSMPVRLLQMITPALLLAQYVGCRC